MRGRLLVYSANLMRGGRCGALNHLLLMLRRAWPALLILAAFSCYSQGGFMLSRGAGAAERNILRISIERTGGVAGTTVRTTIDAKDLSLEEGQKLGQMVEEADFFNLPTKITPRSPRPDRFRYKLTVEEDTRKHMVMVSEEVMPAKLRPLVKWLIEKARQVRKGMGSP